MFSNGSSSSMSRAIVTPSLVIVGEPNFLSRTTLRPFGPIVTRTASASRSMPFLSDRRATSSKMSCLANFVCPPGTVGSKAFIRERRGAGRGTRRSGRSPWPSVLDDRQDVLLADDEELLVVDLELGARV